MSRDALVVGINTYRYLSSLQAPANDAEAIAQQLQTCGEFRVQRLPETIQTGQPLVGQKTQVTLRELEAALVKLFKPQGTHIPHTALFYFSGHGIQKDAGIQEGYLAVSDSNPDTGFYGLSLFWLRRLLQESPVRQRIIWLDCCHSGELLNFLEADPGARPGTDRLFMAASREYEAAYESLDSPYSVFTQAILEGLDPKRVDGGVVTNYSLTDWVSHSLKGEIQQPLFENSGSEIILTRQMGAVSQPKLLKTKDICPYRGLEFFDEAHAEYFFGRETLTDQLITKLRTEQFVAVVGASGSGKSSLVRAGLIWELRRGQKFSGSDRWRIKLITPTEHPLKSLAASFIDAELSDLEKAEQLRRAEVFLQNGAVGFAQLVRASLPISSSTASLNAADQPRYLLVIDQFEEVFTLCRGAKAERERQQFFDCLIKALPLVGDRLRVVIVLRADFFAKCSLYDSLVQQIQQSLVVVTPLTYEQIKATIIRPAEKVGLICETNLIYTMLLDVIGAPGELPLLQYTLLELWQRRQIDPETGTARLALDTYNELGGVRGTLQTRATQIFYELTPDEQIVAKRIFLALTQLGEGTEDTRRRMLKSELVSPVFSHELIERTLEKLVAAKLVITNQSTNTPDLIRDTDVVDQESPTVLSLCETVDVAHEALIRNWELLRNWLDENREMLRRQRQIERAAQEWNNAGQPSGVEYLLRGGRLIDAEDFLATYANELSELAQHYVDVSRKENLSAKRESRLLQIAVPSVLLIALVTTFNQYRNVSQTQARQDYQLQVATSRERAAIAQAILQEPQSDPTAALLISRFAAEQAEPTYEAQSSLRAALQAQRLQSELRGLRGNVQQIRFSADRQYLATASQDGTIQVWSLNGRAIYTDALEPDQIFSWNAQTMPIARISTQSGETAAAVVEIVDMAISPDGDLIAAIAKDSTQVKVWSIASGQQAYLLELSKPVTQVAFSLDKQWIVTAGTDQTVAIWGAHTGQLQTQLTATEAVKTLQFSPNGLLLVGGDRTVQLWRLTGDTAPSSSAAPRLMVSLQHSATLNSANFSPNGQWVLTACADGITRLWDAATGKLQRVFVLSAASNGVASNTSNLPSTSTSSASQPAGTGLAALRSLISPDGQTVATIDANQQVWLWDLLSGQLKRRLNAQKQVAGTVKTQANAIAFSPDSRFIVTANSHPSEGDGLSDAALWNVQSGQQVGVLHGHLQEIMATEFSPDGTYAITASRDGAVRLWSTMTGGELPTIAIPNAPIRWVTFVQRNSGQLLEGESKTDSAIASLITVGSQGQLRQWQWQSQAALDVAPISPVKEVSNLIEDQSQSTNPLRPVLDLLQSVSQKINPSQAVLDDSYTLVFDPSETTPPAVQPTLTPPSYPTTIAANREIVATAFSQDGQWVATASPTAQITLYQYQPDHSLKLVRQWQAALDRRVAIRQLVFNPNGQQLLGTGEDAIAYLWDVKTGQPQHLLQGHQGVIHTARFNADGRWVVTASADHTARIWDTTTGAELQTLPQAQIVTSASFSPNGQDVVTTSQDSNTKVIDWKTGQLQIVLPEQRAGLVDAQYSPNGKLLATVSTEGTVSLWNAQLGIEQAQLNPVNAKGEALRVQQVVFTPDGRYVATLTQNGELQLWAATWEALLKLARDRTPRQLTPEECSRYLRLPASDCPKFEG
jgi:WD40 repeat protein